MEIRPDAGGKPRVAIITPVFDEESALPAYEEAVTRELLDRRDIDFHVLFVDDGSGDESWVLIEDICRRNPRFRGVRLSRNFGSHVALSAGFDHAKGHAMATLACDLQDPPAVVLEFVERWKAGADIVWGQRRSRDDTGLRAKLSTLFFSLVRRYAMPKGSKFTTGSFLLVDARVADCFRRFREHNRVTFALIAWTGFNQDVVSYDRVARTAGKSKWTFGRMLKTAYDAFIGFSQMPGRLITTVGTATFLLSVVALVYLLVTYLVTNVTPGWTGVMMSITLFFGVLFLMIGLMAEYLQRIFVESTARPLYFISKDTEPLKELNHDARRLDEHPLHRS